VIWVYIGEVFPNAVRSKGQGVGNASHWFMKHGDSTGVSHGGGADRSQRPVYLLPVMTGLQFVVVLLVYRDQGADAGSVAARLVRTK